MLGFLNPQKWIGQIAVLVVFLLIGAIMGGYADRKYFPCPPTTQTNVTQQIKAKKNSQVTSGLSTNTPCDCDEYLRGLSVRDFKEIKRSK